MKKRCLWVLAAGAILAGGVAHAAPTFVTITVTPDMVPDEETPLIYNGAPSPGLGPDSWQNTSDTGGKVNWHARYIEDGDFLSILFPEAAATLRIQDIASISYSTLRPTGTQSGEDWSLYIYTRPVSSGWYNERFINDFGSHTSIGNWTTYSTDSGMQFRNLAGGGFQNFSTLQGSSSGDDFVEMISIQTHSNFSGGSDVNPFFGAMDGLVITLTDGSVGTVNFASVVPVPAAAPLGLVGMGLIAFLRRRKKNIAA